MKAKKQHETFQLMISPEQAGELFSPMIEALLKITPEKAQYWIGRKKDLAVEIGKVLAGAAVVGSLGSNGLTADWEKFYCDVFKLEKDFSQLVIPEHKPGFDRLIVVAQGMTPSKIFQKIKELMPARRYMDDLDVVKSERTADGDYAVWIRDCVEADEELKSRSAEDLKKENIPGITLEERLIYELKYFKEAEGGRHLDLTNWTLCAGSRDPNGDVLRVFWAGGRLYVDWYHPDDRRDDLRARSVVS